MPQQHNETKHDLNRIMATVERIAHQLTNYNDREWDPIFSYDEVFATGLEVAAKILGEYDASDLSQYELESLVVRSFRNKAIDIVRSQGRERRKFNALSTQESQITETTKNHSTHWKNGETHMGIYHDESVFGAVEPSVSINAETYTIGKELLDTVYDAAWKLGFQHAKALDTLLTEQSCNASSVMESLDVGRVRANTIIRELQAVTHRAITA